MSQSLALPNLRTFAYPLVGLLLMIFCAKISIPLSPVPVTLMTVALTIIGIFFDKKSALQAVTAYISLGLIGFPVFSSTVGLAALYSPVTGFIAGYFASVWAMTTMREKIKSESLLHTIIVATVGQVILYICGISWLTYLFGFEKAIASGLLPFIIPGLTKVILVSGLVKFIKNVK